MNISIIVAVASNNVIGKTGIKLPWHLPADLAHFKQITMGHPIIMGRKTYQTIGRPLPGRLNIIITRNLDFKAPGCTVATSLNQALEIAKQADAQEAFIIGGSQIFQQALQLTDKVYLTEVHGSPEGDVYFEFDREKWQEVAHEDHVADDKNQFDYSFVELIRNLIGRGERTSTIAHLRASSPDVAKQGKHE